MNRLLKIVLPLLVLAVGGAVAVVLYMARPAAPIREPQPVVPLVRVLEVQPGPIRLLVRSQGTVSPRTESTLVPEVAGQVIRVAPAFVAGGFFEAGEVLLEIDPQDHRQAEVQARAQVALAELRLSLEKAEADIAVREWQDLEGGEATPLTRHQPQLAEAEAALAAAQAGHERARRNIERTSLRAPFAGRVRSKNVDRGQYVTPGTPLATLYAVDFAEIRLPLADADLAFLDLPLDYRGEDGRTVGPAVTLSAEFAGRLHTWKARIVRTEGEIDPRSRMVHTVARVPNPYGRGPDGERPPLAVGMFVQAEIQGRQVEEAVSLPRAALRDGDRLLVVDEESRLRFRQVEILRLVDDDAIVTGGLAAGERVCLSLLSAVSDGMQVQVEDQ